MQCPRQSESFRPSKDTPWRDDDTCSYCGSLSPEALFAAIESGCELGPTDKNYKVYVDRPDPEAGIEWIYGSANYDKSGTPGWECLTAERVAGLHPQLQSWYKPGQWVQFSPKSAKQNNKFYFQHFNEEEKRRFVDLLNAKKITIGVPGYFYVKPFFVVTVAPTE